MKNLLPFLILFCFVTTGMAWPWNKKEVKPKPTPTVVAKPSPTPKPTIQEGRLIAREIAAELRSAKEENTKLKNSLAIANANVKKGFDEIVKLNNDITNLKEWGINQQLEAQKYQEKYTKAVKRYHRLKLIAALIAAAGGVLLGLQFMNLVPPPYNLGVPVGGAALFAALVWFLL
jgi:hypothetical protein